MTCKAFRWPPLWLIQTKRPETSAAKLDKSTSGDLRNIQPELGVAVDETHLRL